MTPLIILFVFIFGTIVGSFLNVVILRYNTGRSTRGRSACFSCRAALSWYELIPIFSFFILRGRCKSCKSLISWQYPIVEFITGVVFSAVVYKQWFLVYSDSSTNLQFTIYNLQNLLVTCYLLLVFSLLIVITVYDLHHKIIPNGLVWGFIFVSLIKSVAFGANSPLFAYDFLAGPILVLPFVAIWFFSGGRAMGFGDAKLALGLGFMLGLAGGISALLLSFWIGGIVGALLLLMKNRKFTMKSEVPFAPFLVVSAFLVFLFDFDFSGIGNWLG